MIEVWVFTLVIAHVGAWGFAAPETPLRIQLPRQEQCEAVRSFLIDLDRLVPEKLHVGECASVLKEGDPR